MLTDGLTLLDTTTINRKSQNFGAAFPASPSDLATFEIINGSGVADGVYIYSTSVGKWVLAENQETGPYDIGLTVFDRPRSLDIVAKHLAVRTFIIEPNFGQSLAAATINASETTVLSIYRVDEGTDTLIGTLTFTAGVTAGTFATTDGLALVVARGQTLKFVSPELRDATLSSIDITLAGRLLTIGA